MPSVLRGAIWMGWDLATSENRTGIVMSEQRRLETEQNVGAPGSGTVRWTTAEEEFAALDQLGPLTRHALTQAPIKMTAVVILEDLRRNGLPPTYPPVDELVARKLMEHCA